MFKNTVTWLTRGEVSVVPMFISEPIGANFTINITLTDIENLYGLGIEFSWDPSILGYVDHLAHIPVEDYPDGVLHEGILWVRDDVDPAAGLYELACTSFGIPRPPSFNGSGIIFDMTFEVLAEGVSGLDFNFVDLANPQGENGIRQDNIIPVDRLQPPLRYSQTPARKV